VLGGVDVDVLEGKKKLLWHLPQEHRDAAPSELAGQIQRAKTRRIGPDDYLNRLDGGTYRRCRQS